MDKLSSYFASQTPSTPSRPRIVIVYFGTSTILSAIFRRDELF